MIGHGWHEVGSFLGPSIRGFYERWPEPRLLEAWRAAGIADVRARRMSLGGGIVTWGRKAYEPEVRPAFYALRPGGWRDYVTLLHPPYTAWHLSYVAVGAALAPRFHLDRMLWALAAFALAMGVAAHALDELNGRPLRTRIRQRDARRARRRLARGRAGDRRLRRGRVGLRACSRSSPSARSSCRPTTSSWFGGRFHTDWWFAIAWGGFAALTGFFVEAQSIRLEGLLAAAYATALSLAQRRLSTPVRHARRTLGDTAGTEPLEQRAARADVGGGADRLRTRGGAPNLEP